MLQANKLEISNQGTWSAPVLVPQGGVATLKVLAAVLGSVILVSFITMILLLDHMGAKQDELAAAASKHQFQGLLSLQSRQLAAHALDYSNWDESINALLVAKDLEWWKSNAGDYAVNSFALSFSMAVDGLDNTLFFSQHKDHPQKFTEITTEPSFRALLQAARSRPISGNASEVAATGIVHTQGKLHLVAAVRFRPEKPTSKPHPDPEALLLFAKSFTGAVLPITAEIMGQPGLHLGTRAGMDEIGVTLPLADGNSAGLVIWSHPRPGRDVVRAASPWLGVLLAMLAIAVAYAARRTYCLMRNMVSEAALRDTLALRNKSILEATAEGIVGFELDGRISFANKAALHMLGQQEPALLAHKLQQALKECGVDLIDVVLPNGESWKSEAVYLSNQTGQPFPADLSITPVWGSDVLEGAVVVFRDITARRAIQNEIYQRAHFDPLTEAPNRNLFGLRFEQEAQRGTTQQSAFAVLLVDIDRFKKINDSMGHEFGDLLLQQAYARLVNCLGEANCIARLGGDEFALLLPGVSDRNAAALVAEKVVSTLGEMFLLDGHSAWAGGSVGIAFYPQDGQSVADLLRCAEMAMYRAKKKGRKTHHFFERSMIEKILSSRALEVNLRQALAREQLVLFYQPIIDIRTRRLSHLEALVRWKDPERGLISPDAFIPLAEETGLIVEIGAWVLDEACRQLATWYAQGLDGRVGIAVNVSGRQVPEGLTLEQVRGVLERHQISGHQLSFEITESVLFDGSPAVTQWLEGIRALDIKLMIDDFGTGYSSLSYIKQFRADALKIDKGFVSGVVDQHEDQSLVLAILAMSHSLSLPVIAEGVETPEQLDWLVAQGCDYAQGYLFGRPVPANECASWLRFEE